jgi:TRAP-type mannitol/chloroaromatic compound transport system substrate-binding protein
MTYRYATDAEYRERCKAYARKYYRENREKIKEYMRKYTQENKPSQDVSEALTQVYKEYHEHRMATDKVYAKQYRRNQMFRSERERNRYATDPEYRARKIRNAKESYERRKKERLNDDRSTEES